MCAIADRSTFESVGALILASTGDNESELLIYCPNDLVAEVAIAVT